MIYVTVKTCLECDVTFEHTCGFKLHLKRVHCLTLKDYTIKHLYAGSHPTCECGCGSLVSWRNDAFFLKLVKGHVTQAMRDAQSNRRTGRLASAITKDRQSQAAKLLFASDEGKQLALRRAVSQRQFYASEEGRKFRQQRSEHLRAFNSTEEGKEKRRQAALKLGVTRAANPQLLKSMSDKLRSYWSSPSGQKALSERSDRMRAFYASKEGRKVVQSTAQKLKVKNLLSEAEFTEKLAPVLANFTSSKPLPIYANYAGYRETFTVDIDVTCLKHGHQQVRKLINVVNLPHCLICTGTFSQPQHDINDYVRSLGVDTVINDRTVLSPLELDIWIPEKNVAVEFNGLYWHCELNRGPQHVDEKHRLAREAGITLLTVYEDEWRDRRAIVEGMIKARLGLASRVHTRKLRIVDLSVDDSHEFFDAAHLEGNVDVIASFGLVDAQGQVVSALSLRHPFHPQQQSMTKYAEIARFATKPGLSAPGALSKLIKRAERWAQAHDKVGLISYVDARVGSGAAFEACGFSCTHETSPVFWWTDLYRRYDRFQRKVEDGILQVNATKRAHVHRIFGTRSYVFVKDNALEPSDS